MLTGWYKESRHKSRALSNCLTCINNTEPWQGKLVWMSFPPHTATPLSLTLSPLLQASPLSFWGHSGGCQLPLNSTKLKKPVGKVQLRSKLLRYVKISKLALLLAAKAGSDLASGQELNVCRGFCFTQHTHIIRSHQWSGVQMEVLWTAACPEMRIARLSYNDPADINGWLKPQATKYNTNCMIMCTCYKATQCNRGLSVGASATWSDPAVSRVRDRRLSPREHRGSLRLNCNHINPAACFGITSKWLAITGLVCTVHGAHFGNG